MKNKKKLIIIIVIVVALLAVGGFVASRFLGGGSSKDAVYVEKMSSLMSSSINASNRYMGVVESQDTLDVNKASDREIEDIFVSVGDSVEVGTKLFSYTTIDLKSQIVQYGFDIEEYNLQIEEYYRQIKELEKRRDAESDENEKKDLQSQIDAVVNSIAIAENNKKSVNTQIEAAKKKIDSSVVTATMAGTISAINKDGIDANGNSAAFMKILASGDIRVKCKVNESNIWNISEGMPVVLRSRVNDDTWTGTVSKINTKEKAQDEGGMTYYSGGSGNSESSTSYNFYVDVDNSEGLMMGQHLYVEPNDGGQAVDFSNGVYLYEYYIAYDDNGDPFVWAATGSMKLEKRKVALGEYNMDMGVYEITDGLSMDDYVAFPMEYLYEGVKCVTSYDEVDESSPMYQDYYDSMSDDYVDFGDGDFVGEDGDYLDESFVDEGQMDEDLSSEDE